MVFKVLEFFGMIHSFSFSLDFLAYLLFS